MKKLFNFFIPVVALVAYSCTTDTTEDLGVELGGGHTTIEVSLEDSRTYIAEAVGNKYPVYWSADDQISVNGVASNKLTEGGSASATFTFGATLKIPYCVAYPAAPEGQVLFAAEQQHTDGTFGDGVATMYGYGKNGLGLALNHLTGVLKIGIKGDATLTKAQISTIDRAPIAGAFAIDFVTEEGEEIPTVKVTPTAESVDVIEYSLVGDESDGYGEGMELSSEAQYIHVAVPAGVYNELYVTLFDKDGGIMYATVKADSEKPLTAGKVREFTNSITYTPDTSKFVIHDYASLCEFGETIASLEKDVVFVNDVIVPEGEVWATIDHYSTYKGTIYGNGYAIKGLTTPLFDRVGADIVGLHLEDVNIVETTDPEVGALARWTVGSNISNCSASGKITINNTIFNAEANGKYNQVLVGGMIGKAQGGSFINCTSDVDLEITSLSDPTIAHRRVVGGFVGLVWDGVALEGVVNKGDISFKPTATQAGPITIGGVLGREYTAVALTKFKNCENYGNITTVCNTTGNVYVGGITQYISYLYEAGEGDHTIFDNLKNHGNITISGKAAELQVGGVISYNILPFHSGAENHGDITISGTYSSHITVGGVHRYITATTKEVEGTDLATKLLFQNFKNSGDITIKDGTTLSGLLHVGGISYNIKPANRSAYLMSHFANIENSGAITIGSVSGITSLAVAGLWDNSNIGFTITNCHNRASGAIKVEGATATGYCRAGGIAATQSMVGYGNNKMEISDCSNAAPITVKPTSAASLCVGGVFGYADTKRIGNTRTFTDVDNSGAIICGGRITGEESITGNLKNNSNTAGVITANAVGGIIGLHFNYGTFDKCDNSGNITIDSTCEAEMLAVGGLVGRQAHHRAGVTTTFKTCNNTGDISYGPNAITMSSFVGGLVGRSFSENGEDATAINPWERISMTDCNAKGAITIGNTTTNATYTYVGTLIGNANCGYLTLNNCKSQNNAEGKGVSISGTAKALYTGMVGRLEHKAKATSTFSGCSNSTSLTIEAEASYTTPYLSSGVSGYSNTEDYLIVEVDKCSVSSKFELKGSFSSVYMYYGGYYGYNKGPKITISNSTHSGDISITGSINARVTVGGIGGYNSGTAIYNTVSNSGDIYFNVEVGGDNFSAFGGIQGYWVTSMTDVSNSGDITILGSFPDNLIVGGLMGYQNAALTAENLSNSGKLSIGSKEVSLSGGGYLKVGGLIGYLDSETSVFTAPMINTGDISVENSTITSVGSSQIGGIVGWANAPVNGARVLCNINSVGFDQTGMIYGRARAESALATYCGVGGTICKETRDWAEGDDETLLDGQVPDVKTLTYGTYGHYIYGGSDEVTTEILDADKNGYISAIDATPVDYNGNKIVVE